MSWAEERRANRAADAEQARKDADAASARRLREQAAVEQARTDARNDRRIARAARWAALRRWAAAHQVDLLIYPLAVVSAIMAVPAMGVFGMQTYGDVTGSVLPILSELGMWAFAIAVKLSRDTNRDRPVWALQLGVWAFTAVSFALNVIHGLDKNHDALRALVMGVASIAGVIAHQLVTAPPRPTRTERITARITRHAERKTSRIREAAVRQAVAEIDAEGNASLVFTPGRYVLDRRGRLTTAITTATADEPANGSAPGLADYLGDEVAAWLATQDRPSIGGDDTAAHRGPVGTLDHGGDQHESTPDRGGFVKRFTRSIDQLRTELREIAAVDPASVDLTSAESIRRTLRCSPARARQLRDEHTNGKGHR